MKKNSKIRFHLLKKSFDKEAEYPGIDWKNLDSKDVQKAIILYNDRINCFKEIRELDADLDNQPTVAKVKRIVELRIRNILCFRELAAYNSKGKYLFKHPLIRQYTERMELMALLASHPDRFLEEYGNCKNNITRYSSYLNRKNVSPVQKEKWEKNLKKHEEQLNLITEILRNKISSRTEL